ncbi:MAG: type II secretion system F family protein [Actinobacteria bacterium]|nr:type II secretion system F family protein [Actinomycetota bacterium]
MKFTYTAIKKDGSKIKGSAEATSKEELAHTLAKQGARPLSIQPQKKSLNLTIFEGKVKLRDLAGFTRQLSTMVSAGVPLTRAFNTLHDQTSNDMFKRTIGEIAKDVEGGISLGDAFQKHPKVFSDVYVNMVRAGEAGGILDEILKRLAVQLEGDASMRKKIKSAMTYPSVILVITIAAFFGIMIFVMPQLGEILKDLGGEDAELPVYTQALLGISDFMRSNVFLVLGGVFATVTLIVRYIRTPKGKYQFHALLLKTPVMKSIVTKIAIARFARTFSSLMAAGVGVLDALEVTGGAIGNKVIEKELKSAAVDVKNGKLLSEPLSDSPHFPAIVAQMTAIGEETGQIDVILVKVADFYEEEVEATIDGLSSIIEPIMIVILGGMVGIIAISVMGPIASLSQNIK